VGDVAVSYRSDIDGLRAVAVALVILFHLGALFRIPGGFVSVDVFFVISGYLITAVILDAIEARRFSFAWFYGRRARRILPALLSMILASAVAGYVVLYPGDYEVFARSAIYAVLACSNIFFFSNTGYFDLPSQSMPLLHTWSLGVEEQFYFVWPLILKSPRKLLDALQQLGGYVRWDHSFELWCRPRRGKSGPQGSVLSAPHASLGAGRWCAGLVHADAAISTILVA
jgi:peptidoglycan/LPS O-acetylase OafA/YrhL